MNVYETEKLVSEYLLFHYGTADEILPYPFGPWDAIAFPVRSVTETFDLKRLGPESRALDVGCAVGRSSFELGRYCREVIGIDYSHRFIEAATALAKTGELPFLKLEEGARFSPMTARVPESIDRSRVHFEQGDAMNLRESLGIFDAVLAANLLCRLHDPGQFLDRLPALVVPGGQLVLTTPCSWMEEFTPRENWLCAKTRSTLEGIKQHLGDSFSLDRVFDLPMLIREHARKFQWTVTQASCWTRIS